MRTTRAPRYTDEEHLALQEAIKQLGPNWRKDTEGLKKAYDQILRTRFKSTMFPNREGKALKAHWDQMIKKGPDNYPWTDEEIEKLQELHAKYRDDFSAIRYELGTGRSVTAIKRKIREIMDENLMNPESPVLNLTTRSLSRAQRIKPVPQEPEEEDTGRVEQLETKFEDLRQEFENVQTELKEVKEALQGLLQTMQDVHKAKEQNPQ